MVDEFETQEVKTEMMYSQPFGAYKKLKTATMEAIRLSYLRFLLPNGGNIEIPIKSSILLGRQNGNENVVDLDLSDFGSDSGVSRNHACIRISRSGVFVRDLGSRNGVFVNGEELLSMRDYPIQDGDELKLGKLKVRVIFML